MLIGSIVLTIAITNGKEADRSRGGGQSEEYRTGYQLATACARFDTPLCGAVRDIQEQWK